MKKGILLLLIPFMFSCSITSRTYTVQFMDSNGNIISELEKQYKAGSKIENPYEINLQAAKRLFIGDKQAVKWEMMMKNSDGTYRATELFFNPEVDVVGSDLVLKATVESDTDFAWIINFKDSKDNLLFTKVVPVGKEVEYTQEEKESLSFIGDEWKVVNTLDSEKGELNIAKTTTFTKDTFAVNDINVDLTPISEWGAQESFKCFAECTWDEIVNVIHGKTRSGKETVWATSDYPTGYARLLFDNVNLPQLESSNREGGKNMAGDDNVKRPHNCFTSGCQKLVHIGRASTSSAADEDDYFVNMVGFDHDVLTSNTKKKASLTLQMVGSLKTAHRFDDAASKIGNGWYTSNNELRTTLNNTSNGYIPTATDGSSTFKVALCKKGSANATGYCTNGHKNGGYNGDSYSNGSPHSASQRNNATISISDDYLWVPDVYEVTGMTGTLGKISNIGDREIQDRDFNAMKVKYYNFYTTYDDEHIYVWYDNSQELNPKATTHSYVNTSPTNTYFRRISDNGNAHAPWYSVAWDRANRKYVANPRGVFEGDRADFKGFTGTTIHTAGANGTYGSSTSSSALSSGIPSVNTMTCGTSQYEYWARFQTETPIGATAPRYKGDSTNGSDLGLYTFKKPSMYKYVHFTKDGERRDVTEANSTTAWLSRSPRDNSTTNAYFASGNACSSYALDQKLPISLMFAIE